MRITAVIRNCVDVARIIHGDLTPLFKRAVAEVCPPAKHIWDSCDAVDHPGRFLAEKAMTTDFSVAASAWADRGSRRGRAGVRFPQARAARPDIEQPQRDRRVKELESFEARRAERREREAAKQARMRDRSVERERDKRAEREKRARASETPAERRRRRVRTWTPAQPEPAADTEAMLAGVMKYYGENADVPNAEAMLTSVAAVCGENSVPARIARTNLARARARSAAAGAS
ncbi:hypothetical protein [Streptomyces sp. NPDC050528]|uniref:hypothetical protein n=1 Tax=Streptomyces sp. NPDC050528 TaxID=3365623 RepID=UPI0037B12054